MDEAEAVIISPEEIKIRQWRLEELRRAGYDEEAAGLLCRDLSVDLRLAEALLANGCSVELALRILT